MSSHSPSPSCEQTVDASDGDNTVLMDSAPADPVINVTPALKRVVHWRKRLGTRLIAATTLAVLLSIGGHTAWLLADMDELAQKGLQRQGDALAENLAVASAGPLLQQELDRIESLLLATAEFPDVQSLRLVLPEGMVISHVSKGADGKIRSEYGADRAPLPPPAITTTQTTMNSDGAARVQVTWSPIKAGSVVGWIYAELSTDRLLAAHHRIVLSTMLVGLLSIIGCAGLIMVFLHRPMKALARAHDFALSLEQGVGQRLEQLAAPIEIEDLQRALDGASIRLEAQRNQLAYTIKSELRMEQEKLFAQKAAETRSQFLANMSHEIRTPMNAVIGMSGLALRAQMSDQARDYVVKVRQSGIALMGIINDILDFSKIDAGRLDIEQVDFDLDVVLESLATFVGDKVSAKGLDLLFDVAADVPRALVGDPLRLGQILVNLTGNAVKFTQSGEVLVRVELGAARSGEVELKFAVRDSGIGMTPEQLGRLFQAFSQADASTTRMYGGTGLGLAISKNLVELMGGHIHAHSQPGVGSTFSFSVRLGLSTQPLPAPSEVLQPERLRTMKVLVVDDNDSARRIMVDLLASMGLTAVAVSSGQEALDSLQESQPWDLVYMDWRMPGLSGIETVRRLQALPDAPPVVMVSAFDREEILREAADIRLQGVLSKPVTASTLMDSMATVLGRSTVARRTSAAGDEVSDDDVRTLRGAHVLLVEDNDLNQELAVALLTTHGITVQVVSDGAQALQALKHGRFDGVLMDGQMPVMDGYEATRQLRQIPQLAGLPVIAMTANVMAGDRVKALEAGMNDLIGKPIHVGEMFAIMGRWIRPVVRAGLVAQDAVQAAVLSSPKASGEDEALYQALQQAGVDTVGGLRTALGQVALYRKLLKRFMDGQRDSLERTRAWLAGGQAQEATREAHTLAGVAGNIGAYALMRVAKELEQACRGDGQDPLICMELVRGALDPVLAALQPLAREPDAGRSEASATSQTNSEGQPVLDEARVRALWERLGPLLQEQHSDAIEVAEQLMELTVGRGAFAEIKIIHEALENFEFVQAMDTYGAAGPALALR